MIDFGEVRSAAHAAPCWLGWERLCALCERATQDERDEQLQPYLARELDRWQPALRELPLRWARQVMERGSALTPAQAAALARLDMPALRRLDATIHGPSKADAQLMLAQLREAPWFDQLDALHLDAHLLEPSDLTTLRPGLARRVNIGDPVDPLWDVQGHPSTMPPPQR
jgi:hypothetical protein